MKPLIKVQVVERERGWGGKNFANQVLQVFKSSKKICPQYKQKEYCTHSPRLLYTSRNNKLT